MNGLYFEIWPCKGQDTSYSQGQQLIRVPVTFRSKLDLSLEDMTTKLGKAFAKETLTLAIWHLLKVITYP